MKVNNDVKPFAQQAVWTAKSALTTWAGTNEYKPLGNFHLQQYLDFFNPESFQNLPRSCFEIQSFLSNLKTQFLLNPASFSDISMADSQVIGGHKATIHNANTSAEAKEHSKEVLKDDFNRTVSAPSLWGYLCEILS